MAKSEAENGKLSSLEKLLILGLVRQGLKQSHIAAALGIHRTSLSRSFPKGLLAEVAGIKAAKNQDIEDGQEASG
ncbi:helix-turn-helix domain-containing protein [Mesorhizobium sp. B4-1-3]|uniref:helix-turn-helix domain-containing protein n=1 Tax=Mesorhizobium sp. B4-1-3 TaxID=2589889 RepID=UPI00112EE57B|nr:helix-turn-helix domain-containing protein [Mesorhizobium sp. B4-1-3]TPI13775.1 helix-turn-helix domain-containing protein [Mesorhizobium sp. B4-1-3]